MSYYINDLYRFLEQLSANNDRTWFKARKYEFDRLRANWLDDLSRLISAIAAWEPSIAALDALRASYRIYRDTRFSPDKTPYKTYFSAAINPPLPGYGTDGAGFYIQIGPFDTQWCGLFSGIWCPDAPVLKKLRKAIVDNIEEWESIVETPPVADRFDILASSSLKTVPKGWPKDHPQARWLRMKDFGLEAKAITPEFFLDPSWPEKAADILRLTKPFVDFLNYSIAEE